MYGSASVSVGPDLARLRMAVTQTRPGAGEAFDVTRSAVNQVRQVLRRYGIPDTAVSTSRLALRSSWNFRGNERTFVGYECTAAFQVELRELDSLETVIVDVVEAGANQVDGVEFDVTTRKQLRAEVREAAVAAAREKAELYARAAGVRLGPVIHIQDVDSEQLQLRYSGHNMADAARGEGDLTPGRITIAAGVLLGFSLIGA